MPWYTFNQPVADHGSGASRDVTFWKPDGFPTDYFYLGLYAVGNYNSQPSGNTFVFTVKNNDTKHPLLAPPMGFNPVWTATKSMLGIYSLIAPPGYTGVGCVVVPDYSKRPEVRDYPGLMCVRTDYLFNNYHDNDLIWNDQGSHAPLDVSVWMSPISRVAIAQLNQGYPASQTVTDLRAPMHSNE